VACRDEDPWRIDPQEGVGDLARAGSELQVAVSVHGPSSTQVDRLELYANGLKIREAQASVSTSGGEKFRLPRRCAAVSPPIWRAAADPPLDFKLFDF